MGRKTTTLDHTKAGAWLRSKATAYELQCRSDRSWDYWRRRMTGRASLTIEDLVLVAEVVSMRLEDVVVELAKAIDEANPARVPGTILRVEVGL